MARWIEWQGEHWHLATLAHVHHLAPATLFRRLERFGETPTGIQRALATGIMTREAAGKRGAERSPWRYSK